MTTRTAVQALIDQVRVRLQAATDEATRQALREQLSALYDERNRCTQ